MEHIEIAPGIHMPLLGFGTYLIPDSQAEDVVGQAIEVGYRHIDTAAYYRNEAGVGRALAASSLPREDFFLTTKFTANSAAGAQRAIDTAGQKLGTYIDLLLIHWPQGRDLEVWRVMEDACESGQVRAIGLSSFYGREFTEIAQAARIHPAVNQCETHPLRQQRSERELFARWGCTLESWSPFVAGRAGFFSHPTLAAIGAKHGKTVAQVTLRWLIQEGIPAIPKTAHRERMEENFDVFDFRLTSEDMAAIAELDTGRGQFGW